MFENYVVSLIVML